MLQLTSKARNLLHWTKATVKCHRSLVRHLGKSFNVFNIVGRATDEVKGHSAFIAELLNPQGSHGQDTAFLKLFLKHLQSLDASPIKDKHLPNHDAGWTVQTEVAFDGGPEGSMGGRIDILLQCNDTRLIIENKIYAGDQPHQLERLRRFAERNKTTTLLYLTLNGRPPNNCSEEFVKESGLVLLSYNTDIDAWLGQCTEAAALIAPVREVVEQYRRLIQHLTNRGSQKELVMDIANELVKNQEYLEAAVEIEKALPEAKAMVQRLFWEDLRGTLAEEDIGDGNFIPDYSFEDKVDKYYPNLRERRYGLSYELGQVDEGTVAWVVEVSWGVYYGLALFAKDEKGTYKKVPLTPEHKSSTGRLGVAIAELEKRGFELSGPENPVVWRYPEGHETDRPDGLNFHDFTSACVKLTNEECRKEVVGQIARNMLPDFNHLRQTLRAQDG